MRFQIVLKRRKFNLCRMFRWYCYAKEGIEEGWKAGTTSKWLCCWPTYKARGRGSFSVLFYVVEETI